MAIFREAVRRVREGAVRHGDEELHQAAQDISRTVCAVRRGRGQPCLGAADMLDCPVCGSHPGQNCVSIPGHPLGDRTFHPEREHMTEEM